VKFAVSYNTAYHGVDPDRIMAYARHAEECGFEIGGSSRAAARRAGRRGDGYFPGGALTPHERGIQLDLARSTAVEAGRNPKALEYTRWGRSTCRSSGSRRSPCRA
jgi:hypothetical protein